MPKLPWGLLASTAVEVFLIALAVRELRNLRKDKDKSQHQKPPDDDQK